MPKNSTSTSAKIIGVAGTFGSGKDTLCDHLVEKYNYLHIATRDIVKEFALKKYGSVERPVLYKMANEIREAYGAGILSQLAIFSYTKISDSKKYRGVCISGLRTLKEAEAIKAEGGIIIFVDAPAKMRYERTKLRARDSETKSSFEEFKKREKDENGAVNKDFSIKDIKKLLI